MSSKLASMIWMAVDPRTPEGEAAAALAALRRLNPSQQEVRDALGVAASEVRVVERMPEFLDPVMPFGKYKGRKLSEIAAEKPNYLAWLLDNTDVKGFLAGQIELAILNSKSRPVASTK